jgi:hypothetical protein
MLISLGRTGYVLVLQEAVTDYAEGLVGLRLHLARAVGNIPAGSDILIGLSAGPDATPNDPASGILALRQGPLDYSRPGGAGFAYPLAVRGTIIGCPFAIGSTHSPFRPPDNLASDDAVDIAVPTGTPVLAVTAGVIGTLIGPLDSADPHLAGLRLHLDAASHRFYYAHLSRIDVIPGQHVEAGQQLGLSGEAAGVPHLHFAQDGGDPAQTIGEAHACPAFQQYYEPWG